MDDEHTSIMMPIYFLRFRLGHSNLLSFIMFDLVYSSIALLCFNRANRVRKNLVRKFRFDNWTDDENRIRDRADCTTLLDNDYNIDGPTTNIMDGVSFPENRRIKTKFRFVNKKNLPTRETAVSLLIERRPREVYSFITHSFESCPAAPTGIGANVIIIPFTFRTGARSFPSSFVDCACECVCVYTILTIIYGVRAQFFLPGEIYYFHVILLTDARRGVSVFSPVRWDDTRHPVFR